MVHRNLRGMRTSGSRRDLRGGGPLPGYDRLSANRRRDTLVPMKTTLTLAAALCAGGVLFAQAPKTHLNVGDMAPDFKLPSSLGGTVTLSEFRGKQNVVVAFFPAAFTGG
jgi:hypothetical protein